VVSIYVRKYSNANSIDSQNHIVHHLLTIFALGASPDQLQKASDLNQYQRPAIPQHDLVDKMTNPEEFSKYLGQEEYFSDYLEYFTREMEKTSWQEVVNEYLFKKDARAEDMLTRTFAGMNFAHSHSAIPHAHMFVIGYLHPLIHLGFGIDFGQPAIVAEALAQAAVHSPWIGPLLLGAEKTAAENRQPSKSLVELLQEIQNDEELKNATIWGESPPFRKGIMGRGLVPMIKYTSQFTVDESELDAKKIEVLEAAGSYSKISSCFSFRYFQRILLRCFWTAYICGAAQRPSKEIKIDFLGMHGVNATILVSAILEQSWLSIQNKGRLLEWVGRFLLALYSSNHVAPLYVSEVSDYIPKKSALGSEGSWENIISRAVDVSDDGHVAKLIRALAFGEKACDGWEEKTPLIIKGKMWRQIGSMSMQNPFVNLITLLAIGLTGFPMQLSIPLI
jgi:hypothetical protein